jgi:hypothetical protein
VLGRQRATLGAMNSSPTYGDGPGRRRDRYQHAVAGLTCLAVAGSLTATGWIAGQAAQAWSARDQTVPGTTTPAQPVGAQPVATQRVRGRSVERPRVVLRDRPTRTRVSTRYVTPAAPVLGGGTVGSSSSHSPHSSPPAPSSGS